MGQNALASQSKSWFAIVALVLLTASVAANGYLLQLYYEVKTTPQGHVSSFCSLNESVDCVAVAKSDYSAVAGVPWALLALEFYGATLLLVAVSYVRRWNTLRWDAMLLWLMLLALPFSVGLGWISAVKIKSLCLLCSVVYLTNIVLLALFGATYRKRFGALLTEGWRAVRCDTKAKGIVVGSLLFVALQFVWVPNLGTAQSSTKPDSISTHDHDVWKRIPTTGLTAGRLDAPIQIVEFSDFQCPLCARAHATLAQLLPRYADTVAITHRDFPLDHQCNRLMTAPKHIQACEAAYYARCAGEANKFWPYSSLLFAHQLELTPTKFTAFATQLGLDAEALARCAGESRIRQRVVEDIEEGVRRNLGGTPTFYVNDEVITGYKDEAFWVEKFEALLRANKP